MTLSTSGALNGTGSRPHLLVSVRSADEAAAALTGGCDILDVKDSSRGSLGRAECSVIERVLQSGGNAGIPVSAALGEVADYSAQKTLTSSERPLPDSLSGLAFTKIGLSKLGHDSKWQARWHDTMSFLTGNLSLNQNAADRRWVAVIYADWQQAEAPSPDDIVDYVLSSSSSTNRFAGVLVDTWSKKSGRLLDSMSGEQLQALAGRVQQSNRFFAIAGRLTTAMLPDLTAIQPDVIAVRSVVCRNEDRTSAVDADAVQQLRADIDETFAVESQTDALPIGFTHEHL